MLVLLETKQRVLRITLNRPEKRNALSVAMCNSILDAVESAQGDSQIGSILLTGNGRVFCAGMDVEEAVTIDNNDELAALHERLFTMGRRSLKPIVVCVNGAALGGGLGLATQGHIVVASSGSAFGLPEIKIGLWPLLVYRSVELALGSRKTLELSLTGHLFDADDALAWGLISIICHPGDVFDRARGLANDLAKASPKAIEIGMTYLQQSREKSFEESGELAKELRSRLMETPDFREGVAAFKEKRDPVWPSLPR